jgi:MFS family permease
MSRSFLGDAAANPLLPVQALHSMGEGLFALSLVGSLFFNVSVDAARPRILLYLALTMAPFAVLAPLIGPVIDKLKGGQRAVLLISIGGRAIAALLLASQLKTLLLYPQAFVIVVLAKVYVVSRNTLVPSIVEHRDHLVVVNSHLARVGAVAGLVAASLGLGILQFAGADWVLRAGAVAYALGAIAVLRIPPHRPEENVSEVVESTEMHGPGIQAATIGMAGLRAATGFALFHVGFSLKTSGQPTWLIGAVAAAAAIGGFGGTFAAPRLRKRLDRQQMITGSVLVFASAAILAALRFHGSTAFGFALVLGFTGSIGRRAFDGVVQTEAPHAKRGKAYAGLETRLELAWVAGALVAVLARAPDWLGLVALAVALGGLAFDRVNSAIEARKIGAEVGSETLPLRLLETAQAVAARGDRQQAVLVALAAADAAALVADLPQSDLECLRARGREAAAENDPVVEDEVLKLAHRLVTGSA